MWVQSPSQMVLFVQGVGRLGRIPSGLVPTPKPGIRSNAAANTSTPTAVAPFDAYSQGSLTYPLMNRFYERADYKRLDVSCAQTGAGEQAKR
jgi:hypothetical protein